MSYNDYGDEPRRAGRRSPREPAGPAKVQGSTAAAILVFVAIVGFGIGALIGNSGGGDDPGTTATEDQGGAPVGSPDDESSGSPSDTDGEDSTDEGDDSTSAPTDPTGGNGITLTSPQDGGEVAAGESGTIDIQAVLDSGEEGVTLRPERSLDGGQTWEPFCEENCPDETSGTGIYTTNFWTGQTGENMFRVVGPDDLVSNAITVNVAEGDDDDED